MESEEVKALVQSGVEHYKAKEFDAAIADFTAAIKRNPYNASIYYNRGIAWCGKKDKARAGAGLIASLMLGGYAGELFRAIGLGFLPSGLIVVVAGPLIGFLIMILSRFVAEQMRLLAALVHNTKCIANGIKDAKS